MLVQKLVPRDKPGQGGVPRPDCALWLHEEMVAQVSVAQFLSAAEGLSPLLLGTEWITVGNAATSWQVWEVGWD